jgi:RNA polymerase sigma factor (sigma-70 family)
MTRTQLDPIVRHVRRLAGTPDRPDPSDAQLLQRFAAGREETAFAALVQRHGPLVLGVCRRVLRHEQDAEDAFQATFLLLARNAASIQKTEAVGSWLYRVAHRVATKAGVHMARQRAREREVGARLPREAPCEQGWRELQEVLQEEVNRLPEKYRAPFVLCCLEGCSGAEAAALLGWRPGTVTSRLNEARLRLRQRLARRGVVLTAVLTATALAPRGARAAVPAALARLTVRAAVLNAAAGTVSARVADLVQGASRSLFPGKARIATAVLLAVSLAAAGVLTHQTVAARQAAAPPAGPAQPAPPPAAPREDAQETTVSGRVLGPDGQPFEGARLYLGSNGRKSGADRVRATTGADGRFRFGAVRADLARNARLVAVAAGLGPDWVAAADLGKGSAVTLRLVPDDVPISGRVLDLEGQPITGAVVQVGEVEAPASGGDLAPWIETRRQWARRNYVARVPMKTLPAAALHAPTSATTDGEGRFRLAGFGRERVVNLHIRGKDLESSSIEVLTRPGPLTGVKTGGGGAYPASFDYHVGPSKPIVGTVHDKRTGKPLAGIRVQGAASPGGNIGATEEARATTDGQGRYRLTGVGKCEMYWVSAEGVPYFNTTKLEIKDTGGVEPLVVDFDLERGIAVKGRLTDRATGQPVRGQVQYQAMADNPNVKDLTELTRLHVLGQALGDAGPDGSFTVLAIPGPGVLCVRAEDADHYTAAEIPGWDGTPLKTIPAVHPSQFHAVVSINPSEKEPKPATCDIALRPGRTRAGTVVGPDGQPLAGARVAGLTPVLHHEFFPPLPYQPAKRPGLKTADFTALGLGPHEARKLVFFHPEKKLGKVQPVRGDEDGPLTVRLEPLGGLTGRVVHPQGRPWVGLIVRAEIDRNLVTNRDLPSELLHYWGPVMEVKTTTDREGKFRLDGLLPGLKYNVVISDGELTPARPVAVAYVEGVSVESGKTRDLGDLKGRETPDK